MHIHTDIAVPAVWERLLNLDELPEQTPKNRGEHGANSPRAYRDDYRVLSYALSDDASLRLELCSGSTNYYANYILYKGDTVIAESDDGDPLESFRDIPTIRSREGTVYSFSASFV